MFNYLSLPNISQTNHCHVGLIFPFLSAINCAHYTLCKMHLFLYIIIGYLTLIVIGVVSIFPNYRLIIEWLVVSWKEGKSWIHWLFKHWDIKTNSVQTDVLQTLLRQFECECKIRKWHYIVINHLMIQRITLNISV